MRERRRRRYAQKWHDTRPAKQLLPAQLQQFGDARPLSRTCAVDLSELRADYCCTTPGARRSERWPLHLGAIHSTSYEETRAESRSEREHNPNYSSNARVRNFGMQIPVLLDAWLSCAGRVLTM